MNEYLTSDRRIEQFLFAHFIHFDRQFKNEQGLTVWVYPRTKEVLSVVHEYELLCRRKGRELNAY